MQENISISPRDRNPETFRPEAKATGKILCLKTGRYVHIAEPHWQAPTEPCKYRSDCMLYAMEQDELQAGPDTRRATRHD